MRTELRYFPVRLRAAEGDDAPEGVLVGTAAAYNVEYPIGFGMREVISSGAFGDALKKRDGKIPIFFQHDWTNPIGTASATETKDGLDVEARLFVNENERARSVFLAAKEGALREWSIGFRPIVVRTDEESPDVEFVDEGELLEASVVVKGANPETEMTEVRSYTAAELRKLADAIDAETDDEEPGPEERAVMVEADERLERAWFREYVRGIASDEE